MDIENWYREQSLTAKTDDFAPYVEKILNIVESGESEVLILANDVLARLEKASNILVALSAVRIALELLEERHEQSNQREPEVADRDA